MKFAFRQMTSDETDEIRRWRYEDVDEKTLVGEYGHSDFVAEDENGEIVGYCTFGRRAMMPPFLDEEKFVGVAWGLRPDLVGNRHGRTFITAIVEQGVEQYRPRRLQACVKEDNVRSLRASTSAGFVEVTRASRRHVLVHDGSPPGSEGAI